MISLKHVLIVQRALGFERPLSCEIVLGHSSEKYHQYISVWVQLGKLRALIFQNARSKMSSFLAQFFLKPVSEGKIMKLCRCIWIKLIGKNKLIYSFDIIIIRCKQTFDGFTYPR